MQTGIHIGTVVEKESIVSLTDAIVRIMETKADQKTIRAALEILIRAAKIDGVSISNCSVSGDTHVAAPLPSSMADDEDED